MAKVMHCQVLYIPSLIAAQLVQKCETLDHHSLNFSDTFHLYILNR